MNSAALMSMLLPLILGAVGGFLTNYLTNRQQGAQPRDAAKDALLEALSHRFGVPKPDAPLPVAPQQQPAVSLDAALKLIDLIHDLRTKREEQKQEVSK